MTDDKRLRGEEEHVITQAEKDAWMRGSKDAIRNQLLKQNARVSPEQAIKIIRLYSELGDPHYISTRLDVSVDEVKRTLASFGVKSIEDARSIVREGLVAEFDRAKREQEQLDRAANDATQKVAQEALEGHQKRFAAEPAPDSQERDQLAAGRQQEAQRQNKKDQIRALIAEGINPNTNESGFRVPLADVSEFKSMIPHGISALKRRFGGTPKDLIREIKRLAPQFNTDLLRP